MNAAAVVKAALGAILDRDLNTLRREVEAYPDELELWRIVPGISNSAGTLVLHLVGNLQHYVGACLGRTTYRRERPAEFSRRDVPRAELVQEIEAARVAVRTALQSISAEQLTEEFPELIAGTRFTTGEYLMHLTTHFAYHLGQVDYHRRVITGNDTVVGAMRPNDLAPARAVPHA